MIELEVEGLDEVLRILDRMASGKGLAPARAALDAGAVHIKGAVATYPPATSANRPGGPGSRWYQRGYGPRWMRKSGGVGGRKTSQTLGRRWSIVKRGAWVRVIGNNVSYGPYVQDEDKQAGFHKARGWLTIQGAVEKEGPKIVEFVKTEIEKAIG